MAKYWSSAQRDLFEELPQGMRLGVVERAKSTGATPSAADRGDGGCERSPGDGR